MFKRRVILLILCAIGMLSTASLVSLVLYFDPYSHQTLAFTLLLLTFVLSVCSIVSVILYFFKKIYYRGNVRIYHIFTSLRQAFFLSVWIIGVSFVIASQIPVILPALIFLCLLIFLEFFIQSF